MQEFATLPKIEESKKNFNKIQKQKREYNFQFPLIEDDNQIGKNHFLRHEQGNDADYYREPKYEPQLMARNERKLKEFLAKILKPNTKILDLAATWESHLPEKMKFHSVFGIGLNKAEMISNDRLNGYFVQDLNLNPKLEKFKNESLDTVLLSFSVQLLIKVRHIYIDFLLL